MRVKRLHVALMIGLIAFFAVFLIWPVVNIVKVGFAGKTGFTLEYVGLIFRDPVLVKGLVNASLVAVGVTLLALAISLPLAVLSVRCEFPGKALLSGLLLVPLVLPPFVGGLGMRLVLGRFGPISEMLGAGDLGIDWLGRLRYLGVVVVEALGLYPIMLVNIQAALANIDPAMEQAAANLGASRSAVFWKITWPMIRPGVFAGCTLVAIWSFTELGTPLIFNCYTLTPVQVFEQLSDVGQDNPLPYALVVVMLAASAGLYFVGKVLLGRGYAAATTKASVQATTRRLQGGTAILATLAFVCVIGAALIPHVSVVLTSLSATGAWYKSVLPAHFTLAHYSAALRDPLAMPSVANSIRYAAMATVVAIVVGMGVAVIVVRSNVPGRRMIDALSMMPLAVPGIVLAFGYLSISITFRNQFPQATDAHGWLAWMNVQEWPTVLLVVAYAARRLPYVVRSAVAGLEQTPVDLELAAANLGASRMRVMRKVTLPLIAGSLIAGGMLAFAFAMLEVSDSIILAQRADYFPITRAILELAQRLGDGLYIASALGVWAMVLLALTMLGANAILGKKIGAMFRV
jgi:iron(III) transport system permease protein